MLKKLISDNIETNLNSQVKVEFTASHIYNAIAMWADKKGLFGVKKYFLKQSEEEKEHGQKVLDYLVDRNANPVIPQLASVNTEYKSLKEVLYMYYKMEVEVEKSWKEMVELTKSENDATTFAFSQFYINEQINEIATSGDYIAQYEAFVEGNQIGFANAKIDELMGN